MKKSILAIAAIAILTVGNTFAQRGYSDQHRPVPTVVSPRADNNFEEYQINQLDNIVKLSRRQENEIKKIENRYDKMLSYNRRPVNAQSIKRLEFQKQQEILSVLTPVQRQRLVAYEQSQKFDNNRKYNRRG